VAVTTQAIVLWQGDRITLNYTVRNPDGSAKDLSGLVVRWAFQALTKSGKIADGAALLDKDSAGSEVTILGGTAGRVDVIIVEGETSSYLGNYVAQLRVVDPGNTQPVVSAENCILVKKSIPNA